MKTCTFFGHKDTPWNIEQILSQVIENLIKNENVTNFYVGNHGNFDFFSPKDPYAPAKELPRNKL